MENYEELQQKLAAQLANQKTRDYFHTLRIHHHLAYNTNPENVEPQSPQLFLENPYPISEPHLPFYNHFDALLKRKQRFLTQLEACKKDFKTDSRVVPKRIEKDVNYGVFPQYLVDICGGRFRDPDAAFPDNCGYNWYYTGGAMECVTVGGQEYIVTACEDRKLRFLQTNGSGGFDGFLDKSFNAEDPVYGIKSSLISNDSLLLTLRQKDRVSVILSTFNENEFCNCLQFENHSEVSFCDANLSRKSGLLFTLKTDGCVESWDVRTGQNVDQFWHTNDDCNMNSYGQIFACKNRDTIVLSNRYEVVITDSRFSETAQTRLKTSYCDDICSFVQKDDYFIFVATKHHLVKYDLRKLAAVASYGHMLESEPYLISCIPHKTTDLICLANQHSKVLIECDETKGSLPLLVPNIKDTYDLMQRKEKVHIYRNLEKRLSSPTIGLKLTQNIKDTVTLFSLNTAGDVYKQRFTTEQFKARSEKKLSKWIGGLPQIETEMVLTEVADMSDARFVLNERLVEDNLARITKTPKNKLISKGNLYGADNYLGSHLEEIWLEEELADEDDIFQVDTSQKVSAWLSAI